MESIAQMFEGYRAAVMSPQAPLIQVHECRRAFFAGVTACITAMQHLPDDLSEADQEALVLALLEEARTFVDAVGTPREGQRGKR